MTTYGPTVLITDVESNGPGMTAMQALAVAATLVIDKLEFDVPTARITRGGESIVLNHWVAKLLKLIRHQTTQETVIKALSAQVDIDAPLMIKAGNVARAYQIYASTIIENAIDILRLDERQYDFIFSQFSNDDMPMVKEKIRIYKEAHP